MFTMARVQPNSIMTTVSSRSSTLALMRLLQLASPTLPVGAYSYSQGLEWAVSAGTVRNEKSAARWIEDVLRASVASFELQCLDAALIAARAGDGIALHRINARCLAGRESAELRAESVQMGRSLIRLMHELAETRAIVELLRGMPEPSYPCAWACAAVAFELESGPCRHAYVWAWLENQVLAAIKLVPLGQSAGQRMLLELSRMADALCAREPLPESEWTNFAPAFGLACAAHETQYTRLFRS